jgi:hypothetical protein
MTEPLGRGFVRAIEASRRDRKTYEDAKEEIGALYRDYRHNECRFLDAIEDWLGIERIDYTGISAKTLPVTIADIIASQTKE